MLNAVDISSGAGTVFCTRENNSNISVCSVSCFQTIGVCVVIGTGVVFSSVFFPYCVDCLNHIRLLRARSTVKSCVSLMITTQHLLIKFKRINNLNDLAFLHYNGLTSGGANYISFKLHSLHYHSLT